MLDRRRLVFAALVLGFAPPAGAADELTEARAFVHRTGDAILSIVNGGLSPGDKHQALARIVMESVDVDGVARFALGRFWRLATPAQRTTYLSLFRRYLVFNVTGRLSQYKGTTFKVGRAIPMNDNVAVTTTIYVPNNSPSDLQWIVSFSSGSPKIVDLVAEGTSLRVTQRSDYASVITRNGGQNVQALLDAMQSQLQRMTSGGSG